MRRASLETLEVVDLKCIAYTEATGAGDKEMSQAGVRYPSIGARILF